MSYRRAEFHEALTSFRKYGQKNGTGKRNWGSRQLGKDDKRRSKVSIVRTDTGPSINTPPIFVAGLAHWLPTGAKRGAG